MMKILSIAGVVGLAGLAGCSVNPYNEARYGTITSVTPHWETVTFFDPAEGCTVYHNDRVDPSTEGAIIGGAAGYILTGGFLGTVIGAGAGAVVDGDVIHNDEKVCVEGQPPQDQQVISHFNVTYDYNGYEGRGTSMTQYQVGDLIPLNNVQAIARVEETPMVPTPLPDAGVSVTVEK